MNDITIREATLPDLDAILAASPRGARTPVSDTPLLDATEEDAAPVSLSDMVDFDEEE